MIQAARERRIHLDRHLAELDGGPNPHPNGSETVAHPSGPKARPR
jgi:hypothetical protein